MKLDRFKPRTVLFLIALALYATSGFPQDAKAATSAPVALRFGQTVALSDFDSDGLPDEARLDGSGLHRRIGIRLSSSGRHISLQFAAKWINHGSLFAQDLDDDGCADLVWTDLVHTDSVVVWLGDGGGNFTRSSELGYNQQFALADHIVTTRLHSSEEIAATCEDDRTVVLTPPGGCLERGQSLPSEIRSDTIAISSFLDQPTDRGPPQFPN